MAWETRKNKQYFYRKRRVNGHVVSEYLGSTPLTAEQAQDAAAERAASTRFLQITAQLDAVSEMVDLLVQAHLLISGYHKHKGQWRKKRKKLTPAAPIQTSQV